MGQCRITVLKKCTLPPIREQYPAFFESCGEECAVFEVGQQFLCQKQMPEGFCPVAWGDLYHYVMATLWECKLSNTIKGLRRSDETVLCCTSGLHPVAFLIEDASKGEKGGAGS